MRLLFNISKHPTLGFLPSAYAVQTDENGQMGYATAKVYAHTLESHSIAPDDVSKHLFAVVEACSEESLENRLNAKSKRKKPLAKLLEDGDVKTEAIAFLERQLDAFLRTLKENGLPLGLEVFRKTYVPPQLLHFADEAPQPQFFFNKTPEGIRYQLRFQEKGRSHRVSERFSEVLSNSPAWVVFERGVHHLPDLNGKMIVPFQKQDELFVAERFANDYFKKFIVRVAAKAEIEAEGFDMVHRERIERAEVELAELPFRDCCGLKLSFFYGKEKFDFDRKPYSRTRLVLGENGEVAIEQAKRDLGAEQRWAEILLGQGLVLGEEGLFAPPGIVDILDLAVWLTEQKPLIESLGLSVSEPMLGEKRICLDLAEQQLEWHQEGDWFDIRGTVRIGDRTVPFVQLAPYIRSGDRLFPLGDGRFAVIPSEWMERFGPFFQLADTGTGQARIAKSQYTLLEDLPLPRVPARAEKHFSPPADLNATLRPYQEEGLRWLFGLYADGLGGCLADDMGLGKTLQTIGMLLVAQREKNLREAPAPESPAHSAPQLALFGGSAIGGQRPLQALVVLPASLVFNWRSELGRFAPNLTYCVHTGSKRARSEGLLRNFDVVLTTYHTLLKDSFFLQKLDFEYVVLDEAQQIKNKDSKLFAAVNELRARNKLSLSGTPIENSLSELWAQMEFVNPGLLGTYHHFKRHYQMPIEKQRDAERTESLRRLIAPFLLRRSKSAVEKDLPELTRQVYYSEMAEEQRKRYEREKSMVRNYILEHYSSGDGQFRIQVLSALTRLRQLANHPALLKGHPAFDAVGGDAEEMEPSGEIGSGKFDDIVHHLDVIRRSGQKALLFSQFVGQLELYGEWLREQGIPFVMLTGSTPTDKREAAVRAFEQDPDMAFFLISIKAGGSGLNLTAADYVLLADPWWNPAVEEQAIARAHRIGQTKKVVAIKFIAKDSIEEKILILQDKKRQIAADFVDQQGNLPVEKEDLEFLVS